MPPFLPSISPVFAQLSIGRPYHGDTLKIQIDPPSLGKLKADGSIFIFIFIGHIGFSIMCYRVLSSKPNVDVKFQQNLTHKY